MTDIDHLLINNAMKTGDSAHEFSEAEIGFSHVKACSSAEDQIWAIDTNYNLLFSNNRFQHNVKLFLGKNLIEGESLLQYNWGEIPASKWKLLYDQVIQNNESVTAEMSHQPKEASAIHFEYALSPIYADEVNQVVGVLIIGRDITDLKMEVIRKAVDETKYRSIVEQVKEMLFLHNLKGQIVDVNPAAIRQSGYSLEELLQLTVFDIDPLAAERLDPENIWNTIEPNQERSLETFHKHKTGVLYPVEVSISKIEIAGEVFILALVRDLTQKQQLQQELNTLNAFNKHVISSMQDGFSFIDKQGLHQMVNESFCKMTGFLESELLGSGPPHAYWPEEEYGNINKALAETLDRNGVNAKLVFKRKNEERFPVIVSSFPVYDESHTLMGFAATIKDISDMNQLENQLLRSEEKQRQLLQKLHQGVFYQSADGIITDVNEAALKMMGLTRDQFIGKDSFDPRWKVIDENYSTLSPEKHPSMRALKFGIEITGETIGFFNPTTNAFNWLIVNAIPIFDDYSGKPVEVFVTLEDITRIKQTELALKQSEANLRELNSTKDKFFSIIAHDLKSPFNSILGLSEILKELIAEKDYDETLKIAYYINESSKKAFDLLLNLLEWSRARTGRMDFSPEYLQLGPIVKECVEMLRETANQKGVELQFQQPNNQYVLVDKAMITTVLRNLLSNAIKFSFKGGKVFITASHDDIQTIIQVRDEGTGIDAKSLQNLFRIDMAVSKPGTNNEKGTGLGLILCKEFIERHGGIIEVRSVAGKGSTFSIFLPKKAGGKVKSTNLELPL